MKYTIEREEPIPVPLQVKKIIVELSKEEAISLHLALDDVSGFGKPNKYIEKARSLGVEETYFGALKCKFEDIINEL